MFGGSTDDDLAFGMALHLAWCPEVRVFFDEAAAREVLARLRGRAVALQIAALYPADTPSAVEALLMEEGLMHERLEGRRLARMVRTGMPKVPLFPASVSSAGGSPMDRLLQNLPERVRYAYGKLISRHQEFVALLDDLIWRLLDPRPISAGLMTDIEAGLVAQGVPARCNADLDPEELYELLLRAALSPKLGRPIALRLALFELRYAEWLGALTRYEACLRAIPDIVSTYVPNDVLLDALTGVPCEGTRAGKAGPWMLADRQTKIMHLDQYLMAAFSRVVLARRVMDDPQNVDQYVRDRGLELDGPPRFAWAGGPFALSDWATRTLRIGAATRGGLRPDRASVALRR